MKSIYLFIVFVLLLTFNSFGQQRYPEKEVTMDHDTMFLKKDMHKISGIVYNEHGELGVFKDGLREGVHKEWFRSGNLKDEISYSNGLKDGEFRYWDDKGQLLKEGHYIKNNLDVDFLQQHQKFVLQQALVLLQLQLQYQYLLLDQ